MKSSIVCVALLFAVAFFHSTGAQEQCASHLCLPPNQCESFAQSGSCPNSGDRCCREVRMSARTQCRQFGGECTKNRCNPRLVIRQAQDCTSGQVCCVYV